MKLVELWFDILAEFVFNSAKGVAMPKYMNELESAYAEIVWGISERAEDAEDNKDTVLTGLSDFRISAEKTLREVKSRWRAGAMSHIGRLGVSLYDQIETANEEGQIVPPFSEGDIAVLGLQRMTFVNLLEAADAKESNKATPTQAIETSKSKG